MRHGVVFVAVFLGATSAAGQTLAPMQAPGLLGIGAPPLSSRPGEDTREAEEQMKATGLKECKVGDRVLGKYEDRWTSAQVIAVDAASPNPCTVHFIGRPPSGDISVPSWKLRAEGERP